ncbi:hypothetical protein Tco_1188161, partial [Tanacetum coccineum]
MQWRWCAADDGCGDDGDEMGVGGSMVVGWHGGGGRRGWEWGDDDVYVEDRWWSGGLGAAIAGTSPENYSGGRKTWLEKGRHRNLFCSGVCVF